MECSYQNDFVKKGRGFEFSPFFGPENKKGAFHEAITQNALSMLPMGHPVLLGAGTTTARNGG
jgi:hypothetical protein